MRTVSQWFAAATPNPSAMRIVSVTSTTVTTRRIASGSTSSMNDSSIPSGVSRRASQMLKPSTTTVSAVPIVKSTIWATMTRRKLSSKPTESNHRKST